MTDERNPSDDVLDALADALYETEDYMSHGDCVNLARGALRYLTTEGFVVVRADGKWRDAVLRYGRRAHAAEAEVRRLRRQLDGTAVSGSRPVPEPATGPPTVEVSCDQCGTTAEIEDGDQVQVAARIRAAGWRTPSPFYDLCPTCGGSGVATTEGNQQ